MGGISKHEYSITRAQRIVKRYLQNILGQKSDSVRFPPQ